jgi:hypothetical protein
VLALTDAAREIAVFALPDALEAASLNAASGLLASADADVLEAPALDAASVFWACVAAEAPDTPAALPESATSLSSVRAAHVED